MEIFVIVVATLLICQATTNDKTSEWSTENQIQKTEIGREISFQIDDKSTIIHLSNTVNVVTSHLMRIIQSAGATYADDLESLTFPLKNIISFIWSTPMKESFQENLYFLFDKILDIVYCTYEVLDDVWHGATYIIETKLSQISANILRIVDAMEALSESEPVDLNANLKNLNETTVELTVSLVALTAITTSIAKLVTTRDRTILMIVGTIASLIIVHEYAVSAVACLISRAIKFINSPDLIHATGITVLEATIIDFVLKLEPILIHDSQVATMTQLFHGDLHSELSTQILASVSTLTGNKMVKTIHATTISLLNIMQEYAPMPFHVLPDLLDQLAVILLQCGHTAFRSLERFITYAFDGLYDVLNHVSYRLDKHIQSSASTGSFPEPSEPIDVALANVRTTVKRFIRDFQHISESDAVDLNANLITSTRALMKALLDPMYIVIDKSDDDLSITLVSSLQFVALYMIGLVATPFIAATRSLENFQAPGEIYANFSATLSLALIKVQMVFDYWQKQSAMKLLKRLYETFDDLLGDLDRLDGVSIEQGETATSVKVDNALLNLL